jgi:DNA-binding response OmpR family regulator
VTDAKGAVQAFEQNLPKLVVLDIDMADRSGFEVCEEIRRRSTTPIRMLSVRDQEDDIVHALDGGADGYLTKLFSPRTRALLRQARGNALARLSVSSLQLDLDEHPLQIGAQRQRFTVRRVLQVLMSSPSRTVTQERLLEQIWGCASTRVRNALKQLIHRLRRKIEIEPTAPVILQTTPASGYRLVPP